MFMPSVTNYTSRVQAGPIFLQLHEGIDPGLISAVPQLIFTSTACVCLQDSVTVSMCVYARARHGLFHEVHANLRKC